MRSALNSSAVWELTTEGERLFHCGTVRGKKEFFRASLYVWYLQYWALCDDLVDYKFRKILPNSVKEQSDQGLNFLSFQQPIFYTLLHSHMDFNHISKIKCGIEMPFNNFANRADPEQAALERAA